MKAQIAYLLILAGFISDVVMGQNCAVFNKDDLAANGDCLVPQPSLRRTVQSQGARIFKLATMDQYCYTNTKATRCTNYVTFPVCENCLCVSTRVVGKEVIEYKFQNLNTFSSVVGFFYDENHSKPYRRNDGIEVPGQGWCTWYVRQNAPLYVFAAR